MSLAWKFGTMRTTRRENLPVLYGPQNTLHTYLFYVRMLSDEMPLGILTTVYRVGTYVQAMRVSKLES